MVDFFVDRASDCVEDIRRPPFTNQQHKQPLPISHPELEAEVEHPTQSMNTVMKKIIPSEPNDPAVPTPTSRAPICDKEIEMTADDITSKIEELENQIEQIKKSGTRRSVIFSDLRMYGILNILRSFGCLSSKNIMELVVHGLIFIHAESRCLSMPRMKSFSSEPF